MGPDEMFKTSPAKSEYVTRKQIIDAKLKAAGWTVAKFDPNRRLDKYDRCAIEEYPTENGPADYALCVDGAILGVVEAKKLSLGPQNVLTQAERYSKGIMVIRSFTHILLLPIQRLPLCITADLSSVCRKYSRFSKPDNFAIDSLSSSFDRGTEGDNQARRSIIQTCRRHRKAIGCSIASRRKVDSSNSCQGIPGRTRPDRGGACEARRA